MFRILAFGDSLTNGFHSDDKSHTPYAQTLEYLLNKDIHRCYTLTTIAKDGTEAADMSSRLQKHLRDGKYYTNNSLHLARKYAQLFAREHYLFREGTIFPRAKFEESCEL